MKFLIIASNSFTGSHFVNYLLENTESEIVAISRSAEYNSLFLPYIYKKERSGRLRFIQMDLRKNISRILELIDIERPDYIVNYAAQGEVRNSWKWPEQWFETNVTSVVRLTNELVKRSFIKKYVSISTPEVYGATGINITENDCYRPSTPYAVSKLAGDLHLMTLWKRYGFPVNFTRAANLYGIHQQLYRIIPRTILYIKKNKLLELHGNGSSFRSFIHARDVADATYRVCKTEKTGEVYHIAPREEGRSIYDLVRQICDRMNVSFERHVKLIDENFGQDQIFSLSSDKIRKELGWCEQVKFEYGLDETLNWIEENWENIKDYPDEYKHKE